MKKVFLFIALSFAMLNAKAIVLDYYLITSFSEKVDKEGNKTYQCVQDGKTYELTIEEYTTLVNGGIIEK
jgi:hypothetical protein